MAPPPDAAGTGARSPLAVVVVDDSAVQRRFARAALEAGGAFTVVGEARNGRDAVALVDRLRPNAVVMDLHLPVMNGIEAIERIMATRPTPILVYSAFLDGDDRDNAAAALAAGAVDVMEKPKADARAQLEDHADALRRKVRVAARVRVITHPRARLGASASTVSTRRLGDGAPRPGRTTGAPARRPAPPTAVAAVRPRPVDVVAVGASTGGPQALAQLLRELPLGLPAAVVVVQHMADGFVEGLAAWLNGISALPVRVAEPGARLLPGTVTVAPSGRNLVVGDRLRVALESPEPNQYHVPGIDATFRSVADAAGAAAVGVLLTGMGRDGAAGLVALRDAGALTIAQDEATSAVYGMPAAAVALGAVDLQLPLDGIAAAVSAAVAPRGAGAAS